MVFPLHLEGTGEQMLFSFPFFSNSYWNNMLKFFSYCRFLIKLISWEILMCLQGSLWISYGNLWVVFLGLDDEWQGWDFLKLAEPLHKWTDRNLKRIHNSDKHEKYKRENIFQIKRRECKNREANPKTSICKSVRNQDIKPVSVRQSKGRRSIG